MALWPIAIPAWTIEWFVQRWKADWEFGVLTATPYFCALVASATYFLIEGSSASIVTAMYILSAMELLALWISLDIARGITGISTHYLGLFSFRKRMPARGIVAIGARSLYVTICLTMITIYWFGAAAYAYQHFHPYSFSGLNEKDGNLIHLFDLTYYSVVTIFTVGYGDIYPKDIIPRILSMCEIVAGCFIIVFLFGSYVSFQVSHIIMNAGIRGDREN
jgi:hypothetical protein